MQRVVARAGLRKAGKALLTCSIQPDRARRVKLGCPIRLRCRVIESLSTDLTLWHSSIQPHLRKHRCQLSARFLQDRKDYLGLIRAGHRFMAKTSPIQSVSRPRSHPSSRAPNSFAGRVALAAAGVDGGDVTGDLEKFASAYEGTVLGERAVITALLAARAAGDSKTLYRLASEFETKTQNPPSCRPFVPPSLARRVTMNSTKQLSTLKRPHARRARNSAAMSRPAS